MAKKTWVNIAGTWKDVKNVWVNVAGVWKQKVIPKGSIEGVWKEFMQYTLWVYEFGIEHVLFVAGNINGAFVKETNRLDIRANTTQDWNVETSAVTDIPIDLTNFSRIYVDWLGSGSGDFDFVVSSNKNGGYMDFDVKLQHGSSFLRTTEMLDISNLTGDFYLRGHAVTSSGNTAHTYIYRIWIE